MEKLKHSYQQLSEKVDEIETLLLSSGISCEWQFMIMDTVWIVANLGELIGFRKALAIAKGLYDPDKIIGVEDGCSKNKG